MHQLITVDKPNMAMKSDSHIIINVVLLVVESQTLNASKSMPQSFNSNIFPVFDKCQFSYI